MVGEDNYNRLTIQGIPFNVKKNIILSIDDVGRVRIPNNVRSDAWQDPDEVEVSVLQDYSLMITPVNTDKDSKGDTDE